MSDSPPIPSEEDFRRFVMVMDGVVAAGTGMPIALQMHADVCMHMHMHMTMTVAHKHDVMH